jgi:hypothetical protein
VAVLGAPKGNKNAFKHGFYTADAIARRRQIATDPFLEAVDRLPAGFIDLDIGYGTNSPEQQRHGKARALLQLRQQDRHQPSGVIVVEVGPSLKNLLQHPDQLRDALLVPRLRGDALQRQPIKDPRKANMLPLVRNASLSRG